MPALRPVAPACNRSAHPSWEDVNRARRCVKKDSAGHSKTPSSSPPSSMASIKFAAHCALPDRTDFRDTRPQRDQEAQGRTPRLFEKVLDRMGRDPRKPFGCRQSRAQEAKLPDGRAKHAIYVRSGAWWSRKICRHASIPLAVEKERVRHAGKKTLAPHKLVASKVTQRPIRSVPCGLR